MAIVGITISKTGEAIQRLAVTTKVAIGQVVETSNGKTRPDKLDHFIFLQKSEKTNEWESDPDLSKHYGVECRDIPIILLNDEIENVFRSELAWWAATEKKCWGDGVTAMRRTEKEPFGEPWTNCGENCPDLKSKRCKPSGDLYFILADFPKLGSVCRLHTTSYQSIRQIYSALEQIRTITGGRLAGIQCRLTVRPARATYMDKGVKKTNTFFALNVELSAPGMKALIGTMTEHANLFQQTRGLLTDGRKVEYVADEEDETTKAAEISEEFNTPEETLAPAPAPAQPQRKSMNGNGNGNGVPVAAIPPAATPAAQPELLPTAKPAQPGAITRDQRRHFFDVCVNAGWSTKQVTEILLEKWGVKSSAEMPADKYEEILGRFESGTMDEPPVEEFKATDSDIPF